MTSTIVCAAVHIGLLFATLALWALFLRLGLRWAQAPNVTARRLVLVTVLAAVLQGAIHAVALALTPASGSRAVVAGLVVLALSVFVPCALIGAVFRLRWPRAFLAWLPTILAGFLTLALLLFVVRPFLYEAFVTPANSMAPTLLGRHWRGTCPECGRPNYCSPQHEPGQRPFGPPDQWMICDNLHMRRVAATDATVHSGDHFQAAKFLAPRRWDLIVFQYPEEPGTLYVKRLVGLPGEKILIQDGSVWIDGERQTPPDGLRGIEYLSKLPDWSGPEMWGSANRPAALGDDEYFVLGDFSAQAKDSRLWEHGAPGHNPFAVPRSHLKGVVIHTYWPPARWRVHR